jgi:hypothetical protein
VYTCSLRKGNKPKPNPGVYGPSNKRISSSQYLPTKVAKWESGKLRYEYALTYKFNYDGTIARGHGDYPFREATYSYK